MKLPLVSRCCTDRWHVHVKHVQSTDVLGGGVVCAANKVLPERERVLWWNVHGTLTFTRVMERRSFRIPIRKNAELKLVMRGKKEELKPVMRGKKGK